ncbi:hypothetical protein OsccyDRAFT_2272 [Leptolyngbyaceae cyanobacterium JSC-12]|nr:hypothetical protein OsccyDRAFT_2272 [Leptolyngbyaceae cyanobacterium JSC-12]
MSSPFPDDNSQANINHDDLKTAAQEEIAHWLEQLRRSDRSLYNLMALEVWSIAQTMDGLIPGFWSRFMANRQLALKEFVEQRKKQSQTDAKFSDFSESITQEDEGREGK